MSAQDWSTRAPMAAGLAALALLLAGFGGWAATARLDGAVVAPAQIAVAQGLQLVQHPDGGVVAHLAVQEGERVARGALLLRLDGTLLRSEKRAADLAYFDILARAARLRAARDGARAPAFPPELTSAARTWPDVARMIADQSQIHVRHRAADAARVDDLRAEQAQVAPRLAGIAAQRQAIRTQRGLLDQELATQKALLSKGLAQQARVLALQREEARLNGVLGQLDADRSDAKARLAQLQSAIAQIGDDRRDQALSTLRTLRSQWLTLSLHRQDLAEKIARLTLRAPVAGVVQGLQIHAAGEVLRPAEPVLSIVPDGAPLQAVVRLSPRNVGLVHPGQAVRLRIPALGHDAPEARGRVLRVSADVFRDPVTHGSYYRVAVRLDGVARLRPGMTAEAFLSTGRRTPLAYMLGPFTEFFARAFRES